MQEDNWEALYTGEGPAGGSSPHTGQVLVGTEDKADTVSEEVAIGQDSSRA